MVARLWSEYGHEMAVRRLVLVASGSLKETVMIRVKRRILGLFVSLLAGTGAGVAVVLCLFACDGRRQELSPPLVHADVSQLDHVDILPALAHSPLEDRQRDRKSVV